MMKGILAATIVLATSGAVIVASGDLRGSVPPACRVQGVWERVATIQAGKRTEFTGFREFKIVTRSNYMWLSDATRRDTLPLKTLADTANYYKFFGGSGTYKVVGNKYTEHLTLFFNPKYEGQDFTFSCRVEGNTWFHSILTSAFGDTTAAGRDTTTEVWRRIE